MVGVWFPISMFIAIGFEHSVANMFILPAGIFSGAPLSWGDILVKNLIPVTIGNAIAGAFAPSPIEKIGTPKLCAFRILTYPYGSLWILMGLKCSTEVVGAGMSFSFGALGKKEAKAAKAAKDDE